MHQAKAGAKSRVGENSMLYKDIVDEDRRIRVK
jgi:hypothetical protein